MGNCYFFRKGDKVIAVIVVMKTRNLVFDLRVFLSPQIERFQITFRKHK